MEKTFQILMKLGKIIPLFLVGVGLLISFFILWIGLLSTLVGVSLFLSSIRKIPADPPTVGLATVYGKRIPIVIPEGLHIIPWYLLIEYIPIEIRKVNLDITYSNIRAIASPGQLHAGGELEVEISITYAPDFRNPERLIAFLNSGGKEGIKTILHDLLEEDIRHLAAERTWEEMAFGREELTKQLIKKLTGEEIEPEMLENMLQDGLPDVADLGIKIWRLTIGRVKPSGALANAIDTFIKETEEKRGEKVEIEFVTEATKNLTNIGISPEEAVDAVQAERGKIKRNVYVIRGFEKFAKILEELLK